MATQDSAVVTARRVRPAVLGGVLYGLVSAGAVMLAGLLTVDADWGMSVVPYVGMWLVAFLASTVIISLWALRRGGGGPRWVHALVPVLLAAAVPFLVAIGGPARDRWQTTMLWAAAAVLTHVALAVVTGPRSAMASRVAAVVAVVAVFAAAVFAERVSQPRWRADDFRLVGVPLFIPDVPGYVLARAAPGRHSLFLVLAEQTAGSGPARTIDVEIGRSPAIGSPNTCRGRAEDRFAPPEDPPQQTQGLVLCLPGHAFQMWLSPRPATPALRLLADQITIRPVPASDLARYPPTVTWEPD